MSSGTLNLAQSNQIQVFSCTLFMPKPAVGTGGILFSGCPFIRQLPVTPVLRDGVSVMLYLVEGFQ